uniref:hypothetical protein n=1 Tax=Helicobacter vulpis TaxID=2316076 RepID=UPI0013CE308B
STKPPLKKRAKPKEKKPEMTPEEEEQINKRLEEAMKRAAQERQQEEGQKSLELKKVFKKHFDFKDDDIFNFNFPKELKAQIEEVGKIHNLDLNYSFEKLSHGLEPLFKKEDVPLLKQIVEKPDYVLQSFHGLEFYKKVNGEWYYFAHARAREKESFYLLKATEKQVLQRLVRHIILGRDPVAKNAEEEHAIWTAKMQGLNITPFSEIPWPEQWPKEWPKDTPMERE